MSPAGRWACLAYRVFPDRLAALAEMRRALKPGGQLAIAAWSHIEGNAIYAALHAALRESIPGEPAPGTIQLA
jgi:ubiquinone/menaquinone biosynthesis C-methylase UbiE